MHNVQQSTIKKHFACDHHGHRQALGIAILKTVVKNGKISYAFLGNYVI